MNWIVQNKEWLFSGIITNIIFFFLGIKFCQRTYVINSKSLKKIKVHGKENRICDNYHEDNSVHNHITNVIKDGTIIDYDNYISLTLGASGVTYKSPANGAFCVKGLTGKFCLNGKIEEAVLPEGKQINVKKGNSVTLVYNNKTQNAELKFYYAKESAESSL